jgi:uncharacterized protein YndB with AHSA1/START domain
MSEMFSLRADIPATPTRVYRALTDAEELRSWLADHAEVSLADEHYEFWGDTTPQGERERQRLLTAEPGRRLRFLWTLDGVKTTVDIELSGGDTTELTLRHEPMPTLDELMAPTGRRDGRHTMHTFWPMAIGNLSEHLAGREGIAGCDFSAGRPREIRVELTVEAPADQVFAAITSPATVEKWWGYAPEIEPRVGGSVTFGAEGRISEWEPGRIFAYDEEGMTTRWELSESDGTTTLTFTQSGFEADELDNAAQHEAGWRGGLLELKRMLNLGADWTPVTRELPE